MLPVCAVWTAVAKFKARSRAERFSPLNNQLGSTPSLVSHPAALEPYVEADVAGPFIHMQPRMIQKLAREGRVSAHPRGDGQRRRWLFLLSELDAWMRARRNSTENGAIQ